jgi:UPF0176 protein
VFNHISFYKFFNFTEAHAFTDHLRVYCEKNALKGTVLIAPEGINGMLAGSATAVKNVERFIADSLEQGEFHFRRTQSKLLPFKKLLVKFKDQILTLRDHDLSFPFKTASYISPENLFELLALGSSSNLVLVDVRNVFEIEMGTFRGALNPGTKKFSDFPKFIKKNRNLFVDKKVITFCTGGIRCEKASALLLKEGFSDVYQLEGGILNYFEKTNGEGFQGSCFVFDERISITSHD